MTPDLLKGVRVVDFTTHVAAPAASRALAAWGADVIKVESPKGDGWRYFGPSLSSPGDDVEDPIWQLENFNKKGLCLDLKKPEGLEAMMKLIATSDIFISSIRINSLKKLGLDYESLAPKFPKLVWGHISGYGLYGDESARPGFDIVAFWARGGFMGDMPTAGSPPISAPYGVGDHTTSLALTAGVCAALLKARATGKGEKVCCSLYNTAIYANGTMITSAQYEDTYPKSRYAPSTPLANSYKTKDNEWIALALLSYESDYISLCKCLNIEHLIDDKRFNTVAGVKQGTNVKDLCLILEETFAKFESAEIIKRMTEADLTFERCRHFAEISKDPQALVNDYFQEYTYPSGKTVQFAAVPIQFGDARPATGTPPTIGQHNNEILGELGYTPQQIAAMEASGAIAAKKV